MRWILNALFRDAHEGVTIISTENHKPASAHRKTILCLSAILVLFFLNGCAAQPLFTGRHEAANRIAQEKGFHRSVIHTASFPLTAFARITRPGEPLTIYLEGDGSAWLSKTWRADDPTPRNPLGAVPGRDGPGGKCGLSGASGPVRRCRSATL